MQAKRFWQLWYYLSIGGLFWAGLTYTTNATCFGQQNDRCLDVSLGYTLFVVTVALLNFYGAYRMYKYDNLWHPTPSLRFLWRGERSFPISFIAFFVFGAVFLGEHLPVIIGFLGNHYDTPDAKLSPFDLGGFGDAVLVYITYLVFGSVLWLLFRLFSWPVIILIGAALGGVAEVFLFLNEQNPAEDTLSLWFLISSLIVWGGLISVIPQIIYQNISGRWGGRGRMAAIVVVILLNFVSIGFLGYQKYVLKRVNYTKIGLPVGICPDRLIDEEGKPAIADWHGRTFTRVGKGAYEWVQANCPGTIEHIEKLD